AVSLDSARESLVAALTVLGQAPPPELAEASVSDIWAWARENWDIGVLRGRTEIAVGDIPLARAGACPAA
ncbi:MAG: hypothetical protein OEN22_06590, partial [Gammaproteobacteria bacterium]|nr:hypothetical protein [Gammaproteobacteria bacterium]